MIYLKKGQKLSDNPSMVVYNSTGYYNDGDSVICASIGMPDEPVCRYEAKFIAYGPMVYSISDPDELMEQIIKLDPNSLFGKDTKQVAVERAVEQIVPQETGVLNEEPVSDTVNDDINTNTNTSTTTPQFIDTQNTVSTTTPETITPDIRTSTTTPEFLVPQSDLNTSTTTPEFIIPDNGLLSTTTPQFIDTQNTVSTSTTEIILPDFEASTTTPELILESQTENVVEEIIEATTTPPVQ